MQLGLINAMASTRRPASSLRMFGLWLSVMILLATFLPGRVVWDNRNSRNNNNDMEIGEAWSSYPNKLSSFVDEGKLPDTPREPEEASPCWMRLECIQATADRISRRWPVNTLHQDNGIDSGWCKALWGNNTSNLQEQNDTTTLSPAESTIRGLYLIKVPKSASSTLAGIVLRIRETHHCQVHYQHRPARSYNFTGNNLRGNTNLLLSTTNPVDLKHITPQTSEQQQPLRRQQSYWVAPIRDPSSRALSDVYYHTVSFHLARRFSSQPMYSSISSSTNSTISPALSAVANSTHVTAQFLTRPRPRDAYIIRRLQDDIPHNYILSYTSMGSLRLAYTPPSSASEHAAYPRWDDLVRQVEHVVQSYDFLVVVDRLDESLVVWAWLAGLSLTDMLTMSAKRSSDTDHDSLRPENSGTSSSTELRGQEHLSWKLTGQSAATHRCIPLVPPVRTTAVQAFFQSVSWRSAHAGDLLLHAVASRALDKTIEEGMGQTLFQDNLQQLRRWQAQIEIACADQTYKPCSPQGVVQWDLAQGNCYDRDFGCGFTCIDRFIHETRNTE